LFTFFTGIPWFDMKEFLSCYLSFSERFAEYQHLNDVEDLSIRVFLHGLDQKYD